MARLSGFHSLEAAASRPTSSGDLRALMRGTPGFLGVFPANAVPTLTRPGQSYIANVLGARWAGRKVGHWTAGAAVPASGPLKGVPVFFDSYGLAPGEERVLLGLPPWPKPLRDAMDRSARALGRAWVFSSFDYQGWRPDPLNADSCGSWAVLAARHHCDVFAPVFRELRKVPAEERNGVAVLLVNGHQTTPQGASVVDDPRVVARSR